MLTLGQSDEQLLQVETGINILCAVAAAGYPDKLVNNIESKVFSEEGMESLAPLMAIQ